MKTLLIIWNGLLIMLRGEDTVIGRLSLLVILLFYYYFPSFSLSFFLSQSPSFSHQMIIGKPQSLGGIPHDTYGMTTNSVHQFVLETLKDHGLKVSDKGTN